MVKFSIYLNRHVFVMRPDLAVSQSKYYVTAMVSGSNILPFTSTVVCKFWLLVEFHWNSHSLVWLTAYQSCYSCHI